MEAQTQKKCLGRGDPIIKPFMGGTKIFSETTYAKPYQGPVK